MEIKNKTQHDPAADLPICELKIEAINGHTLPSYARYALARNPMLIFAGVGLAR